MNKIDRAMVLRAKIQALAVSLDGAEAVSYTELFSVGAEGVDYSVADRVLYEDVLYSCLQAHASQTDGTPINAPSLWARVLIPDPEVIPVWAQPDNINDYSKGGKVYFPDESGPLYESTIDNNVWSPETYPQGWEIV